MIQQKSHPLAQRQKRTRRAAAFLHFDKTGKRLFGETYDYGFARTKTLVGSGNALVGNFTAELGLEVFRCRDPEDRRAGVWLAPLVVPV